MAGTKNQSLKERNRRICLYRRNGFTYSEIADLEDISRARVAQIVAETNEELGEDDGRAEIASLLEFAERKCVELINDPGGVPGPNGRLVVGEAGEPVQNKGILVDAIKTLMVVEDRKAKLYGWERPVRKSLTIELPEAQRQMMAAVEELKRQKELEDRRAMLQGEVVREIEPPATPSETA